jgi:hypothetical protein
MQRVVVEHIRRIRGGRKEAVENIPLLLINEARTSEDVTEGVVVGSLLPRSRTRLNGFQKRCPYGF